MNFQIYENYKDGSQKSYVLKDCSYSAMRFYVEAVSKKTDVISVEVCEVF